MEDLQDWIRAIEQTWIVRYPKQNLATFGITNIAYYVVTEPIYREFEQGGQEGVVRKGRVLAEKPTIITPTYAMNLEGFRPEAYEYLKQISLNMGPQHPGILYKYKNEPENFEIVKGEPSEIAHNIAHDLEKKDQDLSVVMVGVDEWWDVALLKFIYEFTSNSVASNLQEFSSRGLLNPQKGFGGAPKAAIDRIEKLFNEASSMEDRDNLKSELDRWGLFKHYESRFLSLYNRRT